MTALLLTWAAPSGGTLSLFMALWRSPPSNSVVTSVYTQTQTIIFMYMFCFPPTSSCHRWVSVCLCMSEWAPLSRRWAAWSSCRCRKAPPPREPHASRPHVKYPGSCHVSSGFYGTQWSSGSVDSNKETTVRTHLYQTNAANKLQQETSSTHSFTPRSFSNVTAGVSENARAETW